MNNTKINQIHHQGLQVKHVLDLFNISIDDLGTKLDMRKTEVLKLISSESISEPILNKIAQIINVPIDFIKNYNGELSFHTNILSENNTVINYNYSINQNSIENISKIYEIVRELINKEKNS